MRDDLHRTPSLLRMWRTAVRHAQRDADADCVARDLSRGATQLIDTGARPEWLDTLRDAVEAPSGYLFTQTRLEALRELEGTATHDIERRIFEATRALCARDPNTFDVVDVAKRAVHRQLVLSGVAHCTAVVRTEHNASQAAQLNRSMSRHVDSCSLELGRQKAPRRAKGAELLEFEIRTS